MSAARLSNELTERSSGKLRIGSSADCEVDARSNVSLMVDSSNCAFCSGCNVAIDWATLAIVCDL
jgi:hypothetical protein